MTERPIHGVGTLSVARSLCLRTLLLAALCSSLPALCAALGDADVRSFLGQPLDVRVAVLANRQEPIDLKCFSVRAGDRSLVPLSSRLFRLDDSLSEKTLVIRTDDTIETPYLTMEVTLKCDGQNSAVVRSYDLAVPPLSAPVVFIQQQGAVQSPVRSSAPATTEAPKVLKPGRQGTHWVTGSKDTLNRIAKGIYPRSTKMRTAFIQRLREVNATSLPGNGDLLPAGLKITLPDLVELANLSPRIEAQGDSPAPAGVMAKATPPNVDAGAVPAKKSIASPPVAAKTPPPVALRRDADSSSKTTPQSTARIDIPKAAQSSSVASTAQPKTDGPTSGFSLRLSAVDMDLSRSKGVSEATRASLREKQLLLDGDDQVAALLALRHTVKQLEGRLGELQLKLSTMTQPPAPVVTPAPAKPDIAKVTVASAPATTSSSIVAPKSVPETSSPSASVAAPSPKVETPAAKPATPPPRPEASPSKADTRPIQPAEPDSWQDASFWKSSLFMAMAGAVVLLLSWFGLRWARSGQVKQPVPQSSFKSAASDERTPPPPPSVRTSSFLRETDEAAPAEEDPWEDLPSPADFKQSGSSRPNTASTAEPASSPAHDQTLRMQASAPDLFDGSAASLELDTRPATSVDFVLGEDFGEDKSRRQRYMEERFPELAHASISVDEPDSIIDAARHHYEEGQLQKAAELLTYAFEERPGQLRFWLALFEIFRLEGHVTEFRALAARFKNVHGGTDAWPMVQHIGRDLDPGQPMYSAALGRLGVPMDADFDPISENWLNVPMDFTSDVLMIELRHSLMAEHGVDGQELKRPLLEASA